MKNKIRISLGLLLVLAAGGPGSQAGDVMLYRQGETPDPGDIAKILGGAPQPAPAARTKTRGLKLLGDATYAEPQSPDAALAAPPAADAPKAVALQVQFPFNSAEIQPEMQPALDAVAQGIKLAGNKARIVVEGHTDAVGSSDYNLRLSLRRAAAVKSYMVTRHGIPAYALDVVGMGKSAPLVPADPYAPENRRVQFRAVELAPATVSFPSQG